MATRWWCRCQCYSQSRRRSLDAAVIANACAFEAPGQPARNAKRSFRFTLASRSLFAANNLTSIPLIATNHHLILTASSAGVSAFLAPFHSQHITAATRPGCLAPHLNSGCDLHSTPPHGASHFTVAMSKSIQQDSLIFDDDEEETCPLCVEEFDLTDKGFKPCPCGYQV